MAKKTFGEHSLRALTQVIQADLALKATMSEVEGKIAEEVAKIPSTTVVNALDSDSTTAALSAAQGKALDVRITGVDTKAGENAGKISTIEGKLATIDPDADGVVAKADKATDSDTLGGNAVSYFAVAADTTTALAGKLDKDVKGVANGLAPLDESGKISSEYLPSYVDDVIEGTLADGTFSVDGTAITPEKGKIYVDTTTNISYRWGGTVFTQIVSDDIVEMTEDEVKAIWNGTEGQPEATE